MTVTMNLSKSKYILDYMRPMLKEKKISEDEFIAEWKARPWNKPEDILKIIEDRGLVNL